MFKIVFYYYFTQNPDVVILDENDGDHTDQVCFHLLMKSIIRKLQVRVTNQELMEFRETRANQDREYEESLAIDKEKVLLV